MRPERMQEIISEVQRLEESGATGHDAREAARKKLNITMPEIREVTRQKRMELAQAEKEGREYQAKLAEAEALAKLAGVIPHPAWAARQPEWLRQLAFESAKTDVERQGIEDFNFVVGNHIKHNNPTFTISRELEQILERTDLDPTLTCDYIKMPTPNGAFFHMPYCTFQNEEGHRLQGFYLGASAEGLHFSALYNNDIATTFCIPPSRQSIAEYVASQSHLKTVEKTLGYICMLLFYCNAVQYRIEHRPEYSDLLKEAAAKKNPAKKRAVLQRAQNKFDYILIKPAESKSNSFGSGGHKSAHFRRGHFRLQHYGPRWSMERMIFIEPCFIGGVAKIKDYIVD